MHDNLVYKSFWHLEKQIKTKQIISLKWHAVLIMLGLRT